MEVPALFPSSIFCVILAILLASMAALSASLRVVREDQRLSVYRLGRYIGDLGPGLVLLIPLVDRGVLKHLGGVEITPSRRLVGAVGETRSTVYTDGRVELAGEIWDATSRTLIPAGQRVRVVRTILEVEKE